MNQNTADTVSVQVTCCKTVENGLDSDILKYPRLLLENLEKSISIFALHYTAMDLMVTDMIFVIYVIET